VVEAFVTLAIFAAVIATVWATVRRGNERTKRTQVWTEFAARHGLKPAAGVFPEFKEVSGSVDGFPVHLRIKGHDGDDEALYTLALEGLSVPARLEVARRGLLGSLLGSDPEDLTGDAAFDEVARVRGLAEHGRAYLHSSAREPLLHLVSDHGAELEDRTLRIAGRNAAREFTDAAWLDARLGELLRVAKALAETPPHSSAGLARLVETDADARVRRRAFGLLAAAGQAGSARGEADRAAETVLGWQTPLRARGTGGEEMLRLRVDAARHLGRVGALHRVAASDSVLPSIRVAAIAALAKHRTQPEVEGWLEHLLESDEAEVRNAAVAALGRAVGGTLAIADVPASDAGLTLADANEGGLSEAEGVEDAEEVGKTELAEVGEDAEEPEEAQA
jgi:hypothetical protein